MSEVDFKWQFVYGVTVILSLILRGHHYFPRKSQHDFAKRARIDFISYKDRAVVYAHVKRKSQHVMIVHGGHSILTMKTCWLLITQFIYIMTI